MHSVRSQQAVARIEALPPLPELQQLWQTLSPADGNSFFTSWEWIESWLVELRARGQYRLLRVCRGEVTVAAGILVIAEVQRPNRLVRRVVHLHATGDAEIDAIHTEQNDLLVGERATPELYEAAIRCLVDHEEQWDELELQGIGGANFWVAAAKPYGLMVEVDDRAAARIVFGQLDGTKPLWHRVPDKKDRYALRRSLTDYCKALGELKVVEPASASEALEFFDAMCALHLARWRQRGVDSNFISVRTQLFHKRLVAGGFASRRIRILRVTAGTSTVGYVYLLIHNGVANYYQSGFDYQLLGRQAQPGWLCLQLVIEQLRREGGLTSFEFLAGDEHYKRRLATTIDTRVWLRLTRPLPRYRLERAVIHFIRSLRKAQGRLSHGAQSNGSPADQSLAREPS